MSGKEAPVIPTKEEEYIKLLENRLDNKSVVIYELLDVIRELINASEKE